MNGSARAKLRYRVGLLLVNLLAALLLVMNQQAHFQLDMDPEPKPLDQSNQLDLVDHHS